MSVYKGTFSDYDNHQYRVEIDTHLVPGSSSLDADIIMSDSPCIIASSSNGIFSPIKSRSCTLEIVSNDYMQDMYTSKSRDIPVKVEKYTSTSQGNIWKTIFKGYLTPAVYNQTYDYLNTISLEAVEAVSTTKDYKYSPISGNQPKYQKMLNIVMHILAQAGYTGQLYVPTTYTKVNTTSTDHAAATLYISEGNFYDDDDQHTPWTQYEVLEEILKYYGWSLCPDGNNVYLIDYRVIGKSQDVYFDVYNITSKTLSSSNVNMNEGIRIGDKWNGVDLDILGPGQSTIEMDNVYNKIEISDNLYEIEEIAPDIFDDDTHISVTDEQGIGYNSGQWTRTTVTKHWLRPDETSTEVTGYEYQTMCRIKPTTNWKHHFIDMSSINDYNSGTWDDDNKLWHGEVINSNGMNYHENAISSEYISGINGVVNTHGCLIQHYAYRKNTGSILPTSLDWSDYLTFFVANDYLSPYASGNNKGKVLYATLKRLEQPVLEYEIPEEVMFKPSSGTSWITIKGDLFYQYNDAKWGDKNKNTLNIINTNSHFYTTSPVDKASDIDEQVYLTLKKVKNGSSTNYYWTTLSPQTFGLINPYFQTGYTPSETWQDGYQMWKFKVQIGNKFWNGNNWETYSNTNDPNNVNAPTFYIPYWNAPDNDDDDRHVPAFKWMSLKPNTTWTSKIGENCYAIPIRDNYTADPTFGKVKITVYTPLVYPKIAFEILDNINSVGPDPYHVGSGGSTQYIDISSNIDKIKNPKWTDLPICIYAKDFEIGYVYTDTSAWYSQHKANETTSNDIVYTAEISEDNVQTFDDLQLKVNTEHVDKPISRSYVTNSTKYVSSLMHSTYPSNYDGQSPFVGQVQEYNLVDMYYEHYSTPKKIYNVTIRSFVNPYTKLTTTTLAGYYVLDSYTWDLRTGYNTIKIIQY